LQNLLASGKYQFEAGLNKESLYYSVNQFNIIGDEHEMPPGKLDTEPIHVEEIASFFDIDGKLQRSLGAFEHRAAQIEMASQVSQAFNESRILVVEAGTGTGKSLAYLLPSIEWSNQNYGPYGRVIISTNTKNLQEQLFFKDLPIIHGVLKNRFKAVLLKGKANYLCLDKWYSIMGDMKYRLNSYERLKILPLIFWMRQTQTGDIAENNGFAADRNIGVWRKFIAEDNYCPGKSCKYYSHCYLWKVRNHAKNAHLVLVNHSLLFSDLAADNSILNEYANVIFDEAHNIEKVATDYLGIDISKWHFKELLQKLYNKERFETGVFIQLRRRLQLSDAESEKKELVFGHIDSLIPLVGTTWVIAQGFFQELTNFLKQLLPELQQNNFNSRFRYRKTDGLSEYLESYVSEFRDYLQKIKNGIFDLLEVLKEFPEDSFNYQKQVFQELLSHFTQIDGMVNGLDFLIQADNSDWVYWFEMSSREDADDSRLYAAPLNISKILDEKLFSRLKTGIFTSATLTVGKKFDYFMNRIGLTLSSLERTDMLNLDSPFNYQQQVLFAIPAFLPDPRSAGYRESLRDFLGQLLKEQPRGTLVLFTSYSLLNEMYDSLKLLFDAEKIPLLAQGISGSRHSITSEFKQNSRSFLFGTDSFWEGIDVPGNALENLLITKLPFDVPTEPIIQAKAEQIELNGGNAFLDYTIPEAVIKLRQGFGRLIRSTNDIGTIIILDNRVIKKMYGRIFLESLPISPKIVNSSDEMWELLLHWFQTIRRNV
jgi:predicted DnaQ family exonuclease/DinG family helicase